MSSKNKSSKHSKTTNPEPMVRLQESIKAALAALNDVLDSVNAVNAVCDEAATPKKSTKQVKPPANPKAGTTKKPARKPVQQAKAPAKPQTPAPKKTSEKPVARDKADKAGNPGTTTGTGAAPEKQVKRTSASVRLTPHELTLNIGAQSVKELAAQDAKDLLNNPRVFWYRPIQFPDPRRYKVQPRIESVRVVERKAEKFAPAPWTVSVTIAAVGDDKRCESWLSGVLAKNRGEQE